MARATSTISVAITGDSRKLQGALKGADKGVAGFGKSMKGAALGIGSALAGIFAVSKAFDFVQGALGEADRLGDSMSNLNRIIGKTNAANLQKTANAFIDLGLSSADVLELSVGFARIGRTIGISQHIIGRYADDVAAVAEAFSLTDEKGRSAAEWVAIIGKVAAKPTLKNAQSLAISLTTLDKLTTRIALKETGKKTAKSLTDAEKAAARLKAILILTKPVLDDVINNPDLELKQKILGAKIEELQGQLGQGLAPIIADILQNIIDISKSEWVQDLVAGIEVLQGKHDVPIFEDLKKGIEVVQVTFDIMKTDLGIGWEQIQKDMEPVAAAVKPITDAIGALVDAVVDVATHMDETAAIVGKRLGEMAKDAENALAPFARLNDLLISIANLAIGNTSSGGKPSPSVPGGTRSRNPGGSNFSTDAAVAAAIARQRERNGLGN